MKSVAITADYEVKNGNEEIDIEIDYRCFFAPGMAFFPMTATRSIYNGCTLQEAIAESKRRYERQYEKVEAVNVRMDI